MDQSARRAMSSDKTDSILKVVVKHFFIEKEVTSTLVMDSLYSGMKALEGQGEKSKGKHRDVEELPVPIVRVEKEMFVLVDDVLLLLERAALEPLPPKDEKGPQNRTKDGCSGEDFSKDSVERDERRLTELGRRTIEIFVLAHIFSKIEVAYQEAVALKRQEELIREEEAAWLAENEQKARRAAADKEKRAKKKQAKQKRNNRKTKDKGKDEKPVMVASESNSLNDETKKFLTEEPEVETVKVDAAEDVSDVSDSVDCVPEVRHPDVGDQHLIAGNWDTDTSDLNPPLEACSSEISSPSAVQDGLGEKCVSAVDDSSSTCSTDSVPSVVNGSNKRNTSYHKNQKSPNRRHERGKMVSDWSYSQLSETVSDSRNLNDTISEAAARSDDQMKYSNQPESKKDDDVAPSRTRHGTKEEREVDRLSSEKTVTMPSPPGSPSKDFSASLELKPDSKLSNSSDSVSVGRASDRQKQADESSRVLYRGEAAVMSSPVALTCKPTTIDPSEDPSARPKRPLAQHMTVSAGKSATYQVPVSAERPSTQQVPVLSRPLSTPPITGSRPAAPVVSMVQTPPLSRSSSSAGRLGPEPSAATSHSYVPQSYRNVMMGNAVPVSTVGFSQPHSPSAGLNSSHPSFSFGMLKQDSIPSGNHWVQASQRDDVTNMARDHMSLKETRNIDVYKPMQNRSHDLLPLEYAACTSGRPPHGLTDEFPHIDIINDLLEDDAFGKAAIADSSFHAFSNGPQHFHRQFSFPSDIGMSSDLGPSTSSSKFERTLSYHDGLHRSYAAPGMAYETVRDRVLQPNFRPYANGHMDLMPNQWNMAGHERQYLSTREMDNDGYAYHNPADFLNMQRGRTTFSGFHPSNGN